MNAAHFARHALQGALLMLALGGCKTQSSSAPQDAGTPHQQRTDAQQGAITTADVEAIITRVETWRDRPLDSPLKLEAHAKGDTLPVALLSQSIPESVVRAATIWHTHLDRNADATTSAKLDASLLPLDRLAHYDPATHTLHYVQQSTSRAHLEGAIAQAVTRAIDASSSVPLPSSPTLDQWMAQRAVRDGDAALVSASMALTKEAKEASAPTAEQLAMRPETLLTHPDTQIHLGPNLYGTASMLDATQGFTRREGMAFMAALLRSHGWSGVEIALSMPPQSTAQILAPSRWMNGLFAGGSAVSFVYPEAFEAGCEAFGWDKTTMEHGQYGATWLTMWLVSVATTSAANGKAIAELDPQALQALPLSWRADQWRHVTRKENPSKTLLLWTSQWDAPTSANYVSRALQAALKPSDTEVQNATQCEVAQQGLEVAVLCTNDSKMREGAPVFAEAVARDVRIRYGSSEALPLTYKPSIMERLVESAPQIEVSEALSWSDPGIGIRGSLESLAGYQVQPTQTGLVRWYALSNGTTIQFSAEALDVLSPPFDSAAYGKQVSEKFLATSQGARLLEGKPVHHTALGPVHEYDFELATEQDQPPTTVHVWHMRHKDMVWTLSVTSPGASSADAISRARSVFDSLQPL